MKKKRMSPKHRYGGNEYGERNHNQQEGADFSRMENILKVLSKCHVVVGLICLVLSALADYLSSTVQTLRFYGLQEVCSFYFVLHGIVGIVGAASRRRGIIIAFMIMSLHAILIFCPAIIITASFDIHFYQHECWGVCDWHLLTTNIGQDSKCQILCGASVDYQKRSTMTRLGTDYKLMAGLITISIIELLLTIASTLVCSQDIFKGHCNILSSTLEETKSDNNLVELIPLINYD
uniref:MARVEL domain-containing protein n=1 Tax=Strongyloides stercoralis TaxID=6248 RepID=A0A0K0EEB4_STRER